MISIKGTTAPLQCRNCHQLQTKLLQNCQIHFRQRKLMSTQTHYEALSLKRTASQRDIKDAFIKLSKLTHPDLHPNNPEKHKKFVRVNEAYEILSSPPKRKEYDESLSNRDRYGPNFSNDSYTQSHYRHYQGHTQNRQGHSGRGPFGGYNEDSNTFRSGGYYDPTTGKRHLYNDGATPSMSEKDIQNLYRFGKAWVIIVLLVNVLYFLKYIQQRQIAEKRYKDYYTDHRNFLNADYAEQLRLHEEKMRKQSKKRKQKKKKKAEDTQTLDSETLHYDYPTPAMK